MQGRRRACRTSPHTRTPSACRRLPLTSPQPRHCRTWRALRCRCALCTFSRLLLASRSLVLRLSSPTRHTGGLSTAFRRVYSRACGVRCSSSSWMIGSALGSSRRAGSRRVRGCASSRCRCGRRCELVTTSWRCACASAASSLSCRRCLRRRGRAGVGRRLTCTASTRACAGRVTARRFGRRGTTRCRPCLCTCCGPCGSRLWCAARVRVVGGSGRRASGLALRGRGRLMSSCRTRWGLGGIASWMSPSRRRTRALRLRRGRLLLSRAVWLLSSAPTARRT